MRPSGRHRGRLEDHQAGARQREVAEVDQVPVARRAVDGRVLAHRRDDDPVGKRQAAESQRVEQVSGHGEGAAAGRAGADAVGHRAILCGAALSRRRRARSAAQGNVKFSPGSAKPRSIACCFVAAPDAAWIVNFEAAAGSGTKAGVDALTSYAAFSGEPIGNVNVYAPLVASTGANAASTVGPPVNVCSARTCRWPPASRCRTRSRSTRRSG